MINKDATVTINTSSEQLKNAFTSALSKFSPEQQELIIKRMTHDDKPIKKGKSSRIGMGRSKG